MISKNLKIDVQTENPMLHNAQSAQTTLSSTGCHQILANRLLQLANDTDRVGLHHEAHALAMFATSMLDGRRVEIRDA